MKGKDIGSLNVYIQTNESRTLVWKRTGEQGDNWNFGQVGHKGDSNSYNVTLQGVFANGIHGDIAVDDLSLSNEEECNTVFGDESPGCLFEFDHCAWMPSDSWQMSKLSPLPFITKDWQNTLGGFTYFQDCSSQSEVTCYGSLKSPRIFPGTGWKCFQFWYHLGSTGFTSLQVSLLLNETQFTIWTTNSNQREIGSWAYARLPIDSRKQPYQIHFEGWKNSRQAIIAIDDIVFQTESCEAIPWQEQSKDFGKNPLSTKYFWKLDGEDTDISLQGSASYKTEGGIKSLHLNGRDGYAEFPAVDFRKISFSIAIRFKTPDVHILGHLISDWSSPWQFRVFIFGTTVQVVLRRTGEVQFLLRLVSNRLVAFETLLNNWGLVVSFQT